MNEDYKASYAEGLGGIVASGIWATTSDEQALPNSNVFPPLLKPISGNLEKFPNRENDNPLESSATSVLENRSENSASEEHDRKVSEGSSKSDWICSVCGNRNYSWRHVCNMRKCRAPKPGYLTEQPRPPGSWACLNCGNLNYAERTICNMRKCRSPRPSREFQTLKAEKPNQELSGLKSNRTKSAIDRKRLEKNSAEELSNEFWKVDLVRGTKVS